MNNYNPIIAYHDKNEIRGWSEVMREKANWKGWNEIDRSMINHLLHTGECVVMLGWNMYQIIEDK
jgi:hypothetical protein